MNKDRRKSLEDIADRIRVAISDLEGLRDEEQAYFDDMPDSFRDGEKGSKADEAITNLDSAIDDLEEAVSSIESACA